MHPPPDHHDVALLPSRRRAPLCWLPVRVPVASVGVKAPAAKSCSGVRRTAPRHEDALHTSPRDRCLSSSPMKCSANRLHAALKGPDAGARRPHPSNCIQWQFSSSVGARRSMANGHFIIAPARKCPALTYKEKSIRGVISLIRAGRYY